MGSDKMLRESAAQRVFGPQAGVYASSPVHIEDPSLDAMRQMVARTPAATASDMRYGWALDLGTGAGFTAFAMAEFSHQVLAVDPTLGMLQQAQRIASERELSNVAVSRNVAEALPVASGSLDLVTTRMAAHHFQDFEVMLDEVRRVLKPGGVLLMADSVAPEEDDVARWMNGIELRRDYSHIENRKATHIESLMEDRGLKVSEREFTRIGLRFNDWAARTATSEAETNALRKDFLTASTAVKEAFQIDPVAGDDAEDISFSWPCIIYRAVKG
ncbi:MAG: class I SAM-dependent methyltransferase [Chloroflexi bacterium]|nr:class I SAM-dependent methyltransferase [Chloroflexota bacterium]